MVGVYDEINGVASGRMGVGRSKGRMRDNKGGSERIGSWRNSAESHSRPGDIFPQSIRFAILGQSEDFTLLVTMGISMDSDSTTTTDNGADRHYFNHLADPNIICQIASHHALVQEV